MVYIAIINILKVLLKMAYGSFLSVMRASFMTSSSSTGLVECNLRIAAMQRLGIDSAGALLSNCGQ